MASFESYLTVEDKAHIRVVEFMKDKYPDIIFFHIPNEGKKSPFERWKHSLMGNLRGLPDFAILKPKYSEVKSDGKASYKELLYHGLFIELKANEHLRVVQKGKQKGKVVTAKGKLSPDQSIVLEKLNKEKFLAVVCHGFESAKAVIDEYLCNHIHSGLDLEKGGFFCDKCGIKMEAPSFDKTRLK